MNNMIDPDFTAYDMFFNRIYPGCIFAYASRVKERVGYNYLPTLRNKISLIKITKVTNDYISGNVIRFRFDDDHDGYVVTDQTVTVRNYDTGVVFHRGMFGKMNIYLDANI